MTKKANKGLSVPHVATPSIPSDCPQGQKPDHELNRYGYCHTCDVFWGDGGYDRWVKDGSPIMYRGRS